MGMLMRLAIFSQTDTPESIHAPSPLSRADLAKTLGFGELHLKNPRWALVEGAYAAGFGSVVSLRTIFDDSQFSIHICRQISAPMHHSETTRRATWPSESSSST